MATQQSNTLALIAPLNLEKSQQQINKVFFFKDFL